MVHSIIYYWLFFICTELCFSQDAPAAKKVRQLVLISEDASNNTQRCFEEAITEMKNKLEASEEEKELMLMKKIFPEFTRIDPAPEKSVQGAKEFPSSKFVHITCSLEVDRFVRYSETADGGRISGGALHRGDRHAEKSIHDVLQPPS